MAALIGSLCFIAGCGLLLVLASFCHLSPCLPPVLTFSSSQKAWELSVASGLPFWPGAQGRMSTTLQQHGQQNLCQSLLLLAQGFKALWQQLLLAQAMMVLVVCFAAFTDTTGEVAHLWVCCCRWE